ncbi:MAG: hypothetical protein RLZZ179_2330 [Verrucomicrobiota bacterium]|jgi:hypothetical protein
MRTVFTAYLIAASLSLMGQDGQPQKRVSLGIADLDQKIDLGGKAPEDYDWKAYFATTDNSTASDYILASNAHKVLRSRIDELCQQYRELMTGRKQTDVLKVFEEMQQHWEKFAASEILFVGSAWDGGSGAKVAYASHRFEVYLRRVKELRSLKGASMHLNE